jgi:chromosome segregation ATPase
MNNRLGLIILGVIAAGLLIGLIVIEKQASDQQHQASTQIGSLSNDLATAHKDLDEQKSVATMLEKDKEEQKKTFENAYGELTNNFTVVSSNLAQTGAALEATQKEVKERDAKITDLEAQNQTLDKKASDLSMEITNLTGQIEDTQKKLATSEGNRVFLQNELTRLRAEKTELERQFNDLSVLRAQVAKLKDEMREARRLDWIRRGVYAAAQEKGAQRLMQGSFAGTPPTPAGQTNYDLNVEVRADGSVKVIPPLTGPSATTNALPAK